MVFSSSVFLLLFLPITLIGYYNPFITSRKYRNIFLLVASLLFYAWGEPICVLLMICSIVFAYLIGRLLQRAEEIKRRKRLLSFGISVYVLILFIFKYLTFIADQLGLFFHREGAVIRIALPIGISFYLFQLMSYLFDVYYRKARAQDNVLNVGLYVALFPQLIAGPIVRYTDIENQINDREETLEGFVAGILRFACGLGKKVLLANYFGLVVDEIFQNANGMSVATSWIGAIAYTLQIFFDFSGYSDMAIGLGGVFGFRFPENFNYPYIATSVTEFWRRWHMSLSSWFRDYVYIPLGGSRNGRGIHIRNLIIVWTLTGIWHGANWTFLLWGWMYLVVLLFEKNVLTRLKRIPAVIGHIYTMLVVITTWVVFRSETVVQAFSYIGCMFFSGGRRLLDMQALHYLDSLKWLLLAGVAFSTPMNRKLSCFLRNHRCSAIIPLFEALIFVLSAASCVSSGYNPFIYFNF